MDYLNGFIYEYFVRPVVDSSVQGYNAVNTAVYGTILIGLAFFVIFPLLDRKGIKFNYWFCASLIPYILIGTALRAINSAGLVPGITKTLNPLAPGFWTFTPGVWLLTFTITIIGLAISRKLEEKKIAPFSRAFPGIGLVFSGPLVLFLFVNFSNWAGFIAVIVTILAVSFGLYYSLKRIGATRKLATQFNMLVVSGQVIDGLATGFAITFYGFTEQHPLSSWLISMHPVLYITLKVALVLVIVNFVDKEIRKENLRGFIKMFLMILGFATGLASILKIGLV